MMRFQLLQTLVMLTNLQALNVLLTMLAAFATSQNYSPIAKPGCVDSCGNISIPYPFGTTEECYINQIFWVTCNRTFEPPKLFMEDTEIEIKEISPLGQTTIMMYRGYNCIIEGSPDNFDPYISVGDFFTINPTANKFTVVGCDSVGTIYWEKVGRTFSESCTVRCDSEGDSDQGSCLGRGCCQISVPKNVWQVNYTVSSPNNSTNITDNCNYVLLAEDNAFKLYEQNLTSLYNVVELPVVIDWAIGNVTTCEDAQKDASDYACTSPNSSCYKPNNGYGYRCQCQDGYYGNPYLNNGCQDIDECSDPSWNKSCQYNCVNTIGSFNCTCPEGYHGDGKKDGKGCMQDMLFQSHGNSYKLRLVAGIPLLVILLLMVVGLVYMLHKRGKSKRVRRKCFLQNGGELLLNKLLKKERSSDVLIIFSSYELKKATNDFHKENIVGQGGFGTVYKGVLSNKRVVAIKRSKIVDSNQIEQFINEVIVLSQINNENVVKLLGCCLETEVPHLVYEFINNGTLSTHLHHPTRARLLNWELRLRIAVETAGVLSYLHHAPSNPIIHRDVKTDNILLDHNYTAKVADFGASRLVALDETQISTIVLGTRGYLDPEYMQTHQLTTKSDVYSFGVVLLELLTGRRALKFDGPEEERSLVSYSQYMMKRKSFSLLIDNNIVSHYNREQILEVTRLAEWCIEMKGEDRPDMQVVAMTLENLSLRRKQLLVQTEQNTQENLQSFPTYGYDGIATISSGSGTSVGSTSSVFQITQPTSKGR